MNRLADNFTNVYPVSKTLRFELRPIGRTKEYIERDGVLRNDLKMDENYKSVKKLIDRYHVEFIESALEKIEFTGLDEFADLYYKSNKTEADTKKLESQYAALRKQVVARFKETDGFHDLDGKKLFDRLEEFYEGSTAELELVRSFKGFTTYFSGFNENRRNMYSDESKSTAIAFRLVHQNLPKYLDNIKIYSMMMETEISDKINLLEKAFQMQGGISVHVSDLFEEDHYSDFVSQTGIDLYNCVIGGFSVDEVTKVQGLNELINLHNQKNGDRLPKFKPLFKQILSDRDTASFKVEAFESDREVLEAINQISNALENEVFSGDYYITLMQLFESLGSYDLSRIYLKNDTAVTSLSQDIFGNWGVFRDIAISEYEKAYPQKKQKLDKYEANKEKFMKGIKRYSLAELERMAETRNVNSDQVIACFVDRVSQSMSVMNTALQKYRHMVSTREGAGKALVNSDKEIGIIKELMDAYKSVQFLFKPFMDTQTEAEKDDAFYSEVERIAESLSVITALYNKVRNYLTQKPYSVEKVKLNFGNPTFLNGWPVNNETANSGLIFRKDGLYYLGVIAKGQTKWFKDYPAPQDSEDVWEKMYYLQAADPQKDVQNLMVIDGKTVKKNGRKEKGGEHDGENLQLEELKNAHLPADINRIRKTRSYSKLSTTFSKYDLATFIGFYQERAIEYFTDYEFSFKQPEDYADFGEFTDHINAQAYQITFKPVSASYIQKLVDEGALYLFQIYNKDFSPYSKGKPNLHTMYWRMLFDEANLADVVYKLNGEAEVFYRKASIPQDNMTVHVANQAVKNKDPLTAKAESFFPYDLIKDRRFTVDKFQFHVPITLNLKAEKGNRINGDVNEMIAQNNDVCVIGIDRGERNLLYLSVIDPYGNILKQMSLNEIMTYDSNNVVHTRDFHFLLDKREQENKAARQNWTTVNSIKELKEGYLSQVIHVITTLMIEYNAVVVLEDLNMGFKRGRQKFEKQVYQKFEKMLIDKLNYLVDKEAAPDENGGLLHAYQLTEKFESFQKLRKQSGFLFYVPAWNTSKLDPTTGFTNLFYTRYESEEKTKAFIRKFKNIYYDKSGYYAFEFDYKDFTAKVGDSKSEWTVYTYGDRIIHFRNPERNQEWDTKVVDLTSSFTELFNTYGVEISSENMIPSLLMVEGKSAAFYEAFMKLFATTLQMRNSDEKTGVDSITSPVKNHLGVFFTSGNDEKLPLDADANGAYNIAKKGLFMLEQIRNAENPRKFKCDMTNVEWMKYAQEHCI